MKFGFDHVHLVCRDAKELSDYFQRVFDAELIRYDEDFKGAPNAAVRLGELTIFIRGVRPGEEPDAVGPELVEGLEHFGLTVDDVEAAAAWLKERGAEIMVEPIRRGIGGRMIAYVRAPGNIRVELCERAAIAK